MKSQTKLTLPTIASISTIIVTALIGTTIVSQSTSALTYQDSTDVKFTFNPTININLSSTDLVIPELTSGSSSDSNEVTVSVSTNTGYGYYLSATAGTKTGNTSLNNTLDSNYKFTNLTANAPSLSAMPDNSWGYSYSTDNGTTWVSGDAGSTMTGYNGLPLDNDDSGATGIKLVSTDSFTSSSSIKFKIGAKSAPTQAAGTYTNTVNFYAVANPAPPKTIADASSLQEVEACPSTLPTGQVYTVKDSRDNQDYKVARLADGKCWLLDNLALDLTNDSVLNSLSADNTDIDTANDPGALAALKGTASRNPSTDPNGKYATAKVSIGGNNYSVPLVFLGNMDRIPPDEISTTGGYRSGGYYNLCAASAGSYCYGNGTTAGSTSGIVTSSICPKGWRLPTGNTSGEYAILANAIYGSYGSTDDRTKATNYRKALRLPVPGNMLPNGVSGFGSTGLYWTSSQFSSYHTYVLRLYSDTLSIYPSQYENRNNGYSIRCILDI